MKMCIPMLLLGAALVASATPTLAQQQASPSPQILAQSSQDQVAAIAEEFVNDLIAGNYSAALQKYDTAIRTDITTTTLQQGWEDVIAASGPFQRIVSIEAQPLTDPSSGSYIAIITVEFEQATREFFVNLTQNNRIISISPAEEPVETVEPAETVEPVEPQ